MRGSYLASCMRPADPPQLGGATSQSCRVSRLLLHPHSGSSVVTTVFAAVADMCIRTAAQFIVRSQAGKTSISAGVCVCDCVCVCVREPPWHMGAEGHSFWFFIQHLCRGTEGLQGAPSTEALPCNPGKTYLHRLRLGPVVGSWRA